MDFETALDNDKISNRKWDKYKGRDILPLWIADSDYKTAPAVIDALQERITQGNFGYVAQPTDEVKDAITYHLRTQYDWQIESDWIVPLSSIVSGLTLSCMVAGDEGDSILVPDTIYPPFNYVISNTKRNSIQIPMRLENERWILDFEALEASITSESKILLFCNPHNPGGAVYTKNELEQLHSICERHDLLICSDEIHCDLILDADKTHTPIANLNDDAANRTITLMAASKTYNVAGLGFGFAIIPNKTVRTQFKRHLLNLMPEANLLGQVATAAAFNHGESWRLAQIEHLRKNRDYLYKELNSISGLKMYSLESTFLAWVDISALKLDNNEQFFEEAGIGISAGSSFGNKDFIRINFACSMTILEEAVSRIRKAIAGINSNR